MHAHQLNNNTHIMKKIVTILIVAMVLVSCAKEEKKPNIKGKYMASLEVPSGTELMDSDHGTYSIYLPADYETSGKEYPVLYLLHGMMSSHLEWEEQGKVSQMTDSAIEQGVIEPYIIVMPEAYNSFYVNGFWFVDGLPGHQYETFFVEKLMPYIESHYRVKKDREHTAIAGLSMGGYGATYYAFSYPERFSMSYSMSGATEGLNWVMPEGLAEVPSIEEIFEQKGYTPNDYGRLPEYFMDCGTEDMLCHTFNEETHAFLDSINFPHTYRKHEGGHTWEYWQGCYRRMLPDLAKHFNK